MPRLFVPPKVARELAEETRRFNAAIDTVCSTDRICDEWTRELRRLDPLLRMVRAPEQPVLGLPLHAGCYHVVRDNPGAPTSVVTPVLNEHGGFMEPPGRLLDQLKGMDLQDTRVERMRERIARTEAERAQRAKELAREERQEELRDRVNAAMRTSVSMNPDAPWTQNAKGRRGKREG